MDKIFVFDLDNTLIDTQSKVRVLDSNGNVIDRLDSRFYNDNVKHDGKTLDFSEFDDLCQLLSEPELPTMECLIHCLNKYPEQTYILTARQDPYIIHNWAIVKGLYGLAFKNIKCVDFNQYDATHEAKVEYIKSWISSNTQVFFWDDDARNIKAAYLAIDDIVINPNILTLKNEMDK